MTPPGDLCLKNLLNMPPLMVKGCEMRLDLSTGLTEESHTLPVVAYTAVPNKGRRDLFFFLLLFFFLVKKKRRTSPCVNFAQESKRETSAANAVSKQKPSPKQTPGISTQHIQEKANKSVCKPKADSERNERFRRTGFGSETWDIVYRNKKRLTGEQCSHLR